MPTLVDLESGAWSAVLTEARARADGTIVIMGSGAGDLARALLRLGAPPVKLSQDDLVICSTDDMVTSNGALPDLRNEVDLVIALRPWAERSQLEPLAHQARSWAKRGGVVVLAELDAERLTTAQPIVYPAAALYRARPDIAMAIRAGVISTADLGVAAVRARIRSPMVIEFNRPIRVFEDAAAWQSAMRDGGWRGMETLGDDERSALATIRPDRYVATWPATAWEPWIAVAGNAAD